MTPDLVECVPNFSEGRDQGTIDAIARALQTSPQVALLDVHTDPWHHRSVFTLVGAPDAVCQAVYDATVVATGRINISEHHGEHPRIGSTDVVPFIPLDGRMAPCITLARMLGARVGRELEIPVFLYGEASLAGRTRLLPDLRRGGLAALATRIEEDPQYTPDFGPKRLHVGAGAAAVGARPALIAYNVFIDSSEVRTAERIARSIRDTTGGLPYVQARGFLVDGRAQVSMNLLNYHATPPKKAFDAIAAHARNLECRTLHSEFVGLVPAKALPAHPERDLLLHEPMTGRVLEHRIAGAFGISEDDILV